MSEYLLGCVVGLASGFALSWFFPCAARKPPEIRVVVPPEAITQAIHEGKLELRVTPNVMVDWSVLDGIIAAHGYMLVARDEPSPPRAH